MEILPVTAERAGDFAGIIYTAWGETYRGLMPDEILDGRSKEHWEEMAAKKPEYKYIAYIGGEAAGIVSFLPQARDFCTYRESAEVVALYVLKKYQKHGVGKALLSKHSELFGDRRITLFVLKGNENAVGFYKKMGFDFTGKIIHEGGLDELEMTSP